MAKNNPIEPSVITSEEGKPRVETATATGAVSESGNATVIVAIPKTEEDRAALEAELTRLAPSRKALAKMTPEEAAPIHTRRYHICLALDGYTYDRTTVRIPTRQEEREALEHELENPTCYPPNKHVELMTREEESGWRIRRRQIMSALRGDPDDTTPAARELAGRCCGQK
jgi:hypothetical protein